MAGLQAFSGTMFINVLPRWNISETRLASVFTSKGLALEIAQSKDVREGNYSWEIIWKRYILPSLVMHRLSSQHQVDSLVVSLNEENTYLPYRTQLFIFCFLSACKAAYWFLNLCISHLLTNDKALAVSMLSKHCVFMPHWRRDKRNYTFFFF